MATVTITIPPAMVNRVRAAMRATYPDVAALSDVAAFQEVTANHWRQVVVGYEASLAADTARASAVTAAADVATIV